MPDIRLLTLNLHKGMGFFGRANVLPQLREAIVGQAADVVFLQEVVGDHGRRPDAIDRDDDVAQPQHEYIATRQWMASAYGRNTALQGGHMGNALLSRFPILHQQNRDVSVPGTEKRGLLHCVLDVPGHRLPLHTVCVHLGLREQHRRQQIESLCRVVREEIPENAPLVIAGDFNDWRGQGHALMEACGTREAFAEMHGRVARTFPSRWPAFPLDRVYVRHAHISRAEVLSNMPWSHLSDHVALAVSITPDAGQYAREPSTALNSQA